MATKTIDAQFQLTGGRPSGFDYLRIILSVSVIAYHTIVVCYGRDADFSLWAANNPLRPLLEFIIPSFFALSGFLVAGSLFRNTLPGFLALRATRILPALSCEIFISALIIGPALTSVSLDAYFSDKSFYAYFLNILGDIHYHLPGVFMNNPYPDRVNQQLWTIPYEMQCYIALSLLAAFRIVQKRRLFVLVFFFATLFAYGYSAWWAGFDQTHWGPSGRLCVLAFLSGVIIYTWREKIPHSLPLFLGSLIVAYALMGRMETEYFAAFPVAYATVWLGLQNPRKIFLIAGADYSYGMYLYGYPIQQAMMQLFPFNHAWYANLALSLVGSAIFAYLSWNLVELKIMNQKKRAISFVNAAYNHVDSKFLSRLPSIFHKTWAFIVGIGDKVDQCLCQIAGTIWRNASAPAEAPQCSADKEG